jgi:hypothetical protein
MDSGKQRAALAFVKAALANGQSVAVVGSDGRGFRAELDEDGNVVAGEVLAPTDRLLMAEGKPLDFIDVSDGPVDWEKLRDWSANFIDRRGSGEIGDAPPA